MNRTYRSIAPLTGGSVTVALLAMLSFATATSSETYPRPGETVKMRAESAPASTAPVAVSADARYVAFLGDFGFGCCVLALHDRQTGTTTNEASTNFGGSIPISADGRYFAYALSGDVFVRDRQGGFETISVAPDGGPAECDWVGCVKSSGDPSLSADGRFVAFHSFASNLVLGDNNQTADVFVRDRQTGITERVSVATDGTQGDAISVEPSISADGRFVAFMSEASILVPGAISEVRGVYLHDRLTGTTERVSLGAEGSQDVRSWAPSISADGRYVAFTSAASTLVPNDTNAAWDVFVRDRQTGRTERVSVTPDGAQAGCPPSSCRSGAASISPDGRYVVFHSFPGLVSDDTNLTGDIFVHDRETGATERVSLAYEGGELPGHPPGNANSTSGPDADQPPAISADGRIVVFDSFASNLVEGDGGARDAFVRDRGPAAGVGKLVASCGDDPASASGWATFSGAAISSADDPADDGAPGVPAAAGELTNASIAYRPELGDLFVRFRVASLPPGGGGAPGVLYGLKIAVGDIGIRYEVRAQRSGATGTGTFALYNCEPPPGPPTCTLVDSLTGSIGTTGAEILVSVPLESLGASEGVAFSGLSAYTALGDGTTGPGVPIDDVPLPPTALPAHSVSLGIAPAGTPESQVAFDTQATLANGNFSGTLPPVAGGSYDVWARACLGTTCGAASMPTVCNATDLCVNVVCTPLDPCHDAGVCDPATGICSNPNAPDGTACSDGDACTSDDACTGGACGGTPVEPPSEVGNTLRVTQSGATSVISWSDDGNPGTFHLYRGTRTPEAPWSYNQQCLGGEITGTSATDAEAPASASMFFYLVTRTTPCGESIAGRNSEGEAVPNTNPCP